MAIVDPDLLAEAPPALLLANGFDALSQLIEPFLSARASPLTDAWAREGIRRSVRSLRRAVLEGPDAGAREDLALASLLGGLCLANAGLGAVHGFAAPAGGMLEAPHGAICAALLAPVLAVNLRRPARPRPEPRGPAPLRRARRPAHRPPQRRRPASGPLARVARPRSGSPTASPASA